MRQLLTKWGTTFIYWSFAITAVTGVLLFARIHTPPNEQLHIWIGFLMIAAFVTHVARNWRSFLNYFRKPQIWGALAITLVISALFAWPVMTGSGGQGGGPPGLRSMGAVSSALSDSTIATLAPVAKTDPAGLIQKLAAVGVPATDASQKLGDVVRATGKDTTTVLGQVLAGGRPSGGDAD